MRKKILTGLLLLFSTLFISGNAGHDSVQGILLIVMDGARYDYCTPETMPNLHAFMRDGVQFKNAYAPCSWTLPSHASLFTGLYPQQHGAIKLPYDPTLDSTIRSGKILNRELAIDDISISEYAITLADMLSMAGYETVGVFGNPCYGYPIFNLNKGFETWVNVVEKKLAKTGNKRRGFYTFDYTVNERFYTVIPDAYEVHAETIEAITSYEIDRNKPLFLFINFEDPIATYRYFPPEMRTDVLEHYQTYLKKSMKKIDDVLPPILSYFQNGLIIVTSDHGQGDGTKFPAGQHGSSLHPNQTKIPLLVRNAHWDDLDVNQPMNLVNVMDIILQTAGLKYPDNTPLFRPRSSNVFAHLDNNPEVPKGIETVYGIYGDQNCLVITYNHNKFSKEFNQFQTGDMEMDDLIQCEQNLLEIITPFMKLERVYPLTKNQKQIGEQNLEMLKNLGYIQK